MFIVIVRLIVVFLVDTQFLLALKKKPEYQRNRVFTVVSQLKVIINPQGHGIKITHILQQFQGGLLINIHAYLKDIRRFPISNDQQPDKQRYFLKDPTSLENWEKLINGNIYK